MLGTTLFEGMFSPFFVASSYKGITSCALALLASVLGYFVGRWVHGRGTIRASPLPPGPNKLPIIGNLLVRDSIKLFKNDIDPYELLGHAIKLSRPSFREDGQGTKSAPLISSHPFSAVHHFSPNPYPYLRSHLNLGGRDAHNHADSDIIYLDVAGTNVVVLNSYKACIDLLDNRSSIYSGRPRLPMVVELMGWDKDFVVLPYGTEWKIRRRLCLQEFPDNGSIRHESEELQVNRVLLKNLLSDPENYRDHLHYMTGSLTILVTYGIDIKSKDDPVLELAATALNALLHALSPGTFAVDALPWLKYVPEWMPGAGFQRKAKQWKELNRRLNHEPFEMVKEQMEKGSARPSFVSNALTRLQEDPEGCGYTEEEVMNTATTMYEGGTDTTWTGLLTFILAMTLHPECQRKAQTEIGRIVGEGRLPDHSDRDALVYVQAVIHEVQRWQPITPTAIVHHVNVEDEYRGYRIQRTQLSSQMSGGFRCPSLVLVTHEGVFVLFRAILHDEEMYPDPYTFNPERWIKDGQIDPDIRDITASFGFGRRICPGRLLALSSLYLTIATILSVFNISKATDENGVAIEPRVEYSSSVQNRPLPFKCSIKPRSEAHERLINELAEHEYDP